MQRLLPDFRRVPPFCAISWVRHFGLGLGLGLVILILLQAVFQPFHFSSSQSRLHATPALSIDVAALGQSLEHNGFANPHQIAAHLERIRKDGRGRIAWIQLRNSNGTVVAQTGLSNRLQHASKVPVFVKSYPVPLPAGQFARLDIGIRRVGQASRPVAYLFSASAFI